MSRVVSKNSPPLKPSSPGLSRPTTASVMKMIHKLVPSPYTPKKKKIQAEDMQKLIDKVNRNQRKTVDIHKAFVKSLTEWGADLPTHELKQSITVFCQLLEAISVSVLAQCESLAAFKVGLSAVADREKRQRGLLARHDELHSKMEASALKTGPHASATMLFMDEIEENEYNLKLVEQQLARTATINLRGGYEEFTSWVTNTNESLRGFSENLAKSIQKMAKALESKEDAKGDHRKMFPKAQFGLGEGKAEINVERFHDSKKSDDFDTETYKPTPVPENRPYGVSPKKVPEILKIPPNLLMDPHLQSSNQFHSSPPGKEFKIADNSQIRSFMHPKVPGVLCEGNMGEPSAYNPIRMPKQKSAVENRDEEFLWKKAEEKYPVKQEAKSQENRGGSSLEKSDKTEASGFRDTIGERDSYGKRAYHDRHRKGHMEPEKEEEEKTDGRVIRIDEKRNSEAYGRAAVNYQSPQLGKEAVTFMFSQPRGPTRQDTLDSPESGHVAVRHAAVMETKPMGRLADYDISKFERNHEGWGQHSF